MFSVDYSGNLYCPGVQANTFQFTSTLSSIGSASGTRVRVQPSSGTTMMLQIGATNTNASAAIVARATLLEARLADDSGFTSFQSLYQRFGAGSPEGVVTAPIGAFYSRTDGGAGTSFYVKESGTGNTGWVAK